MICPQYITNVPYLMKCGMACGKVLTPKWQHSFNIPASNNKRAVEFFQNNRTVTYWPRYEGYIANGYIVGPGVVISPDGNAVCRDLSTSFNCAQHEHWLLNRAVVNIPLDGAYKEVHCIATLGGNSYYHWLIEEVPRIIRSIRSNPTVIYASGGLKGPLELLLRLLNYRGKLFYAKDDMLGYRFEKLHYQSLPGDSGMPDGSMISTLRRLGNLINTLEPTNQILPKKVFISRRRSRRIINEEEIYFRILMPLGFRRIFLEDVSWVNQIKIFQHADVILGIHGAGLSNVVFMRPGTKMLEIFSSKYAHWCYWHLAEHAKVEYYACISSLEENIYHGLYDGDSDFFLDSKALDIALSEFILN
jgi:hypothetical protein